MTRLSTFPDAEAAAGYAAQAIADALRDALALRGRAHLGLAGGSTPRATYEALAGCLANWSAVELWYGDERCVGAEDPESNHRLVAESLLAGIAGAQPREHRIQGELGAERAAEVYERELCESATACAAPPPSPGRSTPADEPAASAPVPDSGNRAPDSGSRAPDSGSRVRDSGSRVRNSGMGVPVLDVVLLGIGEDGHTASLFPGQAQVRDDGGRLCLPVHDAPKPPPDRVTLSLPVLRAARSCLLLATGAGKAAALAAALAGPKPEIPASMLASERLHVIADAAASAGRTSPSPPPR